MIFSHISDTHLGQTQYGRRERETDMYDSFTQAIDISIKDHVDFVILAGDLFDHPNASGRTIVYLGNELKKLRDAGIGAYFVLGEHDISRVSSTPVAYVYNNLGVAKYIGNGKAVTHGDTLIMGFDKMRRDELATHADALTQAQNVARQHTGPSVLVLHQGVMEINKFAGEMASKDIPNSFSYYAMGHLHEHSERRFEHLGGPLVYPGSTEISTTEGVHESEKGFCQVDLSGSEASVSWMRLETRPHKVFSIPYEDLRARVASITEEISAYKKAPVVRLDISGKNVDTESVYTMIDPIYRKALHCMVETAHSSSGAEIISKEPTRIRDELVRLTKKILEDDVTELAINDLLPALSEDRIDDAMQIIMDDYAKFRSTAQ